MDKNRLAAISCGIIAAFLVIMAGKSCTEGLNEPGKKSNKTTTSSEASKGEIQIDYPDPASTSGVQYDMFGRPVRQDTTIAPEAATEIEPVTDEFGNIIETTTAEANEPTAETVTDVFGNVIATIPPPTEPETQPEDEGEKATLSPLDQFNEDAKKPPPDISGFHHGRYDKDGNLIPTIPPDYVIIIE